MTLEEWLKENEKLCDDLLHGCDSRDTWEYVEAYEKALVPALDIIRNLAEAIGWPEARTIAERVIRAHE